LIISLGGKIVDVMVVQGPLDFNFLLGRNYVYAMEVVVSTLFRVIHFPHDGNLVIIDHISCDNPYAYVTPHSTPLCAPSVQVDSTLPRVNYVASYPLRSIVTKKEPMFSCSSSLDMVTIVDLGVSPMGALETTLPPVGQSECYDTCFV